MSRSQLSIRFLRKYGRARKVAVTRLLRAQARSALSSKEYAAGRSYKLIIVQRLDYVAISEVICMRLADPSPRRRMFE
jgi:hypothetical protein